jgi:DNA-binding NarL/FixJ family response regulator
VTTSSVPGEPIRILVADDQTLVRTGFRMILSEEPDFEVVAEAGDGEQAVHLAGLLHPDVILMDVRMPGVDGITAARRIRTAVGSDARPRILMLTTFDLDEYVYDSLRVGASGFLLKDILAADLVTAVRVVHAGESVAAPTVTRRLIEHFVATRPAELAVNASVLDPLTARERHVLTLIARGMSNAEIAADLHLSEGTVKTHMGRILAKLGLRDRVQAVILGYSIGLVAPDRSG